MIDFNKFVELYRDLENRRKVFKADYDNKDAPLREAQDTIKEKLLTALQDANLKNVKTNHGTAYITSWTSCTVQDWPETLKYIIDNEAFDLLERRVSKTAVQERGEVPGVHIERGLQVNIRKD